LRERALKVKKQLEEEDLTSTSQVHNDIVRGDNLKPIIQRRIEKIDPKNEFNQNVDNFDDDSFINCYYQFFTTAKPNELAVRLERVADRQRATTTIDPSQPVVLIRCAVAFGDAKNEQNDKNEDDVIIAVKQFIVNDEDSKDNNNNNNNNNDNVNSNNINHNNADNHIKDINNDHNINSNNNNAQKTQYLVVFKRLKGDSKSYRTAVEQYYYAIEIMEIMDIDDISLLDKTSSNDS